MLFISLSCLQHVEAQGVELRLDLLPTINFEEIGLFCQKLSCPIIFTLRRGSNFKGSEEERLQLIEKLLSLSPQYVDLEHDTDPEFLKKIAPSVKIIISYHNFESTPDDLQSLLSSMFSPYAYAYKIATMENSSLDALRMVSFVRSNQNIRLSGICMGSDITRILGPVFGNFIDYAAQDEKTAQGQLTVSGLALYRYSSLNPKTALYGLIGDPIEKSASHVFHNNLFSNRGLDAVYIKMRVKKEELKTFLLLAQKCGFSGLSVTMPLKEEVVPLIDADSSVQGIGASNTLLFKEGKILGCNTDGKGALDAIESKISVKGKKIVLIGAGGAARAIAYEASKRGAGLTILNRDVERVKNLAKDFSCSFGKLEDVFSQKYDVIINATPAPLPVDYFIPNTVAMDIKNFPKETLFLQKAKAQGCSPIYGHEMFVNQAMEQFRLWFNK